MVCLQWKRTVQFTFTLRFGRKYLHLQLFLILYSVSHSDSTSVCWCKYNISISIYTSCSALLTYIESKSQIFQLMILYNKLNLLSGSIFNLCNLYIYLYKTTDIRQSQMKEYNNEICIKYGQKLLINPHIYVYIPIEYHTNSFKSNRNYTI